MTNAAVFGIGKIRQMVLYSAIIFTAFHNIKFIPKQQSANKSGIAIFPYTHPLTMNHTSVRLFVIKLIVVALSLCHHSL